MFTKNKFIVSVLLGFIASTSISNADETTWVFETDSAAYDVDNSGNNFGNQLSIDTDNDGNPELTIEAWADTGCGWNCGNDSQVGQGFADTNQDGLLNYNLDAPNNRSLTGEDHVIDNRDDVDMLLFSFSESVALTGIDLGYFGHDSDISIAAFSTLPTLTGDTWSEIATQSIYSASFSNIGISPYTLVNEVSSVVVEAQYWLIGAYTSIFGDLGADSDYKTDSFKIAAITTEASTPTTGSATEVAEPSTIAMFASFGLFMMWRRKKSS